ncbi:MAG: hypothetical protein JWM20_199 [Patescibacteria group bacterium]|nr:hypothetical protein [Patescibacteria group bacterium]
MHMGTNIDSLDQTRTPTPKSLANEDIRNKKRHKLLPERPADYSKSSERRLDALT